MASLGESSNREEADLASYYSRVPVLYVDSTASASPMQITIPTFGERARGFNDLSQLNLIGNSRA